ncbi:MAG: glycine cleavage system protein GcvH [Ghiorsea sp.]
MSIPADLKYTKDHEWVRIEGDTATFGVSDHAQEALGDIVFVELPEIGKTVEAGDAYAVVESVKAVSDVYAPVSGEVIAVNEDLEATPEHVNTEPYGSGWIAKLKIAADVDTAHLMNDDGYNTFLEE